MYTVEKPVQKDERFFAPKPNLTNKSDTPNARIETGFVPVHYNTGKPAQLQAIENSFVIQRYERNAGNYGNKNILTALNGNDGVRENRYVEVANGHNFVLGWDSMVTFTRNEGAFQIGDVFTRQHDGGVLQNENIQNPPGEGAQIRSVVTRGVDTCTVVLVSNGVEFAMLHLDGADLAWGLGRIQELVGGWNPPISSIFVSYADDGHAINDLGQPEHLRNDFVNDLRHAFNGGHVAFHTITRGRIIVNHSTHSEIGVGFDDDDLEIFGDMLKPNLADEVAYGTTINDAIVGDEQHDGLQRFLFNRPFPLDADMRHPEQWNAIEQEADEEPQEPAQVAVPPPQANAQPGLFAGIGGFFRRLFRRR